MGDGRKTIHGTQNAFVLAACFSVNVLGAEQLWSIRPRQCWSQPEEQTFHFPNVPWEAVLVNSTLCCKSKPPTPSFFLSACLSFFFSFSLSHSLHTTVHTPSLPLCSRPLGLWSSGVRWVGVLVGGSRGCRAAWAGIQGNMHREITIAPLGDLQMLAGQGIAVGSYRHTSISWETAEQHIQPANLLSLLFFPAAFSLTLHLPFTFFFLLKKFEPLLHNGNIEKNDFPNGRRIFQSMIVRIHAEISPHFIGRH